MTWYLSASVTSDDVTGAYQAFGSTSQAVSYVNLNNSGTNDLTAPGTAPSWTAAGGWSFTSDVYLATGDITITHETSVLFSVSDLDYTGLHYAYGFYNSATVAHQALITDVPAKRFAFSVGNSGASYNTSTTSGIFAITQDGIYYNGNLVTSVTTASTSFSASANVFIGATNLLGTPVYSLSGKIQFMAFYNRNITAEEIKVLTSNINLLFWVPGGNGAKAINESIGKITSMAAAKETAKAEAKRTY